MGTSSRAASRRANPLRATSPARLDKPAARSSCAASRELAGYLCAVELGTKRRSVGAERGHKQPLAQMGAIPFHRQRRRAERLALRIDIVHEPARPQHVRIIEQVLRTID